MEIHDVLTSPKGMSKRLCFPYVFAWFHGRACVFDIPGGDVKNAFAESLPATAGSTLHAPALGDAYILVSSCCQTFIIFAYIPIHLSKVSSAAQPRSADFLLFWFYLCILSPAINVRVFIHLFFFIHFHTFIKRFQGSPNAVRFLDTMPKRVALK